MKIKRYRVCKAEDRRKSTKPQVKARLKKALIEAHGYGVIPGCVAELVFKVADLKKV